jgi:hypothetical protein
VTTNDALAAWLAVRQTLETADLPTIEGPLRGSRDGHVHFLETVVQARSPERAANLQAALKLARADAAAEQTLTFARLSCWHGVATGQSSNHFRRTTAFAKDGEERYGIEATTEHQFAACLSQANEPGRPLLARSTCAYLDVLFFHPFADGNARAAALTLDFVLFRAGIVLSQVGPLFMLARRADDPDGPVTFALLLEALIRATGRDSTRCG